MMLNQGKLDLSKMRGVLQMKNDGLALSTPSDEVAKLWDSILFQSYGFFDAPEVYGIKGSVESIQVIDPSFPLLKTLTMNVGMKNFDHELRELKNDLNDQFSVHSCKDRVWTQFERNQIQALIYRLEGYDDLALEIYRKELAKNPLDIVSLKNAIPIMILNGSSSDIAALAGYASKALPVNNLYYPFVRSYEAFGLEEQGQLKLALDIAKESLEICHWNSWSHHTVAHVFDAQGKPDSGLEFMYGTRGDWMPTSFLSCHNNWHIGLFHLDNNDISEALNIWDTEIFSALNKEFSHFLMSDAVSLLARIELEPCCLRKANDEFDLSNRWKDLFHLITNSTELESGYCFYDAHLALAMASCGRPDMVVQMKENMLESVSKYENRIFEEWETDSTSKLYSSGILKSTKFMTTIRVLLPFTEALKFFEEGEYQSVVNILHPIRNQLNILGGSKTQNDIFHRVLASSLLMAGGKDNTSYLDMMLFQRQEQRDAGCYSERIYRNIINHH